MTVASVAPQVAGLVTMLSLLGAVGGSYVSVRLLRPNEGKILAQAEQARAAAKNELSEASERMFSRYQEIITRQDEQLASCHQKIEVLAEREEACERRAADLAERVAGLERRAGLDDSPSP